jgi:hypothetical protein
MSHWLIEWLNHGLSGWVITEWVTGWLSCWITVWVAELFITECLGHWLIEWLNLGLSGWVTACSSAWVIDWQSHLLTVCIAVCLADSSTDLFWIKRNYPSWKFITLLFAPQNPKQSQLPVFFGREFPADVEGMYSDRRAQCCSLPATALSLSLSSPLCSCITICLVLHCYAGHFLALFICPVS